MPNFYRKVVSHPKGGAIKIDNHLWASPNLTSWIGKKVWCVYYDFDVQVSVFECDGIAGMSKPIAMCIPFSNSADSSPILNRDAEDNTWSEDDDEDWGYPSNSQPTPLKKMGSFKIIFRKFELVCPNCGGSLSDLGFDLHYHPNHLSDFCPNCKEELNIPVSEIERLKKIYGV